MADPLHGVTLAALVEALVERYGWEELGRRVPIRCFLHEPTLGSSLKFLRKTPWARRKVEALYVRDLRERERKRKRNLRRAHRRALATLPVERDETLALIWPAEQAAPEGVSPEGYAVTVGVDREAFAAVQAAIGFAVTDAVWDGLSLVDGAMAVVRCDGAPVAVACAEHRAAPWVELGWVAVDPVHRGRGLGRVVTASVVAHLLDAGLDRITGSTQDARLHALRIYLGLGFVPVDRPEKEARWAAVRAALADG